MPMHYKTHDINALYFYKDIFYQTSDLLKIFAFLLKKILHI